MPRHLRSPEGAQRIPGIGDHNRAFSPYSATLHTGYVSRRFWRKPRISGLMPGDLAPEIIADSTCLLLPVFSETGFGKIL
jgi:hypothetical protein